MDITNVKRETLAKQYDEAKAKYIAAKEPLKSDFAKVFHEWFVENGIDEFCSFNAEDEGDGCVFVTDGHENFGIPVRYYKRWKEDGSARYELTMNYSCFGSFASDNVAMVRFATVIGKLAEDLANLQNRLSRLNWLHVRELQKSYYRAEGALDAFDAEVAAAEHDRKVAEVLPYIKVGGKFNVGREWNGKPIIATIVDVKRKYVDFDRVIARKTREQIADKVISGRWTVCK